MLFAPAFRSVVALGKHPAARLLVLPLVALAIYARDPGFFESPRLWAEEGSHYFQSALEHDRLGGLTNIAAAEHNPYLHLVPLLATWGAAHFVPLELAPAVTTGAWIAIVLALVLVVLYGRASMLDGWPRRLLALAAPFLAVSNAENWANTLGAHFWADFAALLLALEGDEVTGRRRTLGLVAFALLALLSPTGWILLPAVLSLCARNWPAHRSYLYALGGTVALQVAVSVLAFPGRVRHAASIPEAAHLVVSKLLIWPLSGFDAAEAYVELVQPLDEPSFAIWGYLLAMALVGLIVAFARASRRDASTGALLWTHLAATAGFVLLGLHVGRDLLPVLHGARYSWLPNALLIVLLGHQLELASLRARKPSQLVFGAALLAAIVVGVAEYPYAEDTRGADWRAEVERHRLFPDYTTLQIWPQGWSVRVPR